jgi:SAM-dependent methyltransferase
MMFNKPNFYKLQTELTTSKTSACDPQKKFARLVPWYRSFLLRYLPENKDAPILDCPCGSGNILFFLREMGFTNYKGIDIDPNRVLIAAKIGLPAEVANVFDYLKDNVGQFQMILAVDIIEHLNKEEVLAFFNLAIEALLPGGRILCRTPCADGPFSGHDRYNDLTHEIGFSSHMLSGILAMNGFVDIKIMDERPQPYKLVNLLRLTSYLVFTKITGYFLNWIGLTNPRVWTSSMWATGIKKDKQHNDIG